jgi:hypothetical protein
MTSARELADRERELNAYSQAVYGRSHAEFCDMLYAYAFAKGREQGKQEGRRAGFRAAKGRKAPAKKRGRPSKMDEGERALLIHSVEERNPEQTIKEAVTYFLHVLKEGKRYLASHSRHHHAFPEPITPIEGERAYYRHRRRQKLR